MNQSQNNLIAILTLSFSISGPSYGQQGSTLPPTVINSPNGIFLQSNTVYTGLRIANPQGPCLQTRNNSNNIVLKDSIIGPCKNEGIRIFGSSDIRIENSVFHDVASGIMALGTTGNIVVSRNQITNVHQIKQTPSATKSGHHIQFANVSGGGNRIEFNVGENFVGLSDPAEGINIFKSNGTASSPIEVVGNSIRGGGYLPNSPSSGGENSGGILAGDGGGSNINVKENTVVRAGLHGVSISGGTNNKILNNTMYSPQTPFSNAGLQVKLWQNPNAAQGALQAGCSGHEVQGNKVDWTSRWGNQATEMIAKGCGDVIGWANNDSNVKLSEGILPAQLIEPVLKAYYTLDNNTEDSSGYAINANATSTSYISAGNGSAALLTGAGSAINTPSSAFLDFSPFSVTAWVNPDSLPGSMGIAQSQNGDGNATGWRIIASGSSLQARITTRNFTRRWDAQAPAVSTEVQCQGLTAGKWSFIAVTYNGEELQCSVNGTLGDAKPASGLVQYSSNSSGMKIGSLAGVGPYIGALDEFKVYRGALSAQQIKTAYDANASMIQQKSTPTGGNSLSKPTPPTLKLGAQ